MAPIKDWKKSLDPLYGLSEPTRADFVRWHRQARLPQIRYIAFLTAVLYLLYGVLEQGTNANHPDLRLAVHGFLMPGILVTVGVLSFYDSRYWTMIRLLVVAPVVAIAFNLFLNAQSEYFALFAPELYLALIWILAISGLTLTQGVFTAAISSILIIVFTTGNGMEPGAVRLHYLWMISSLSFGLLTAFLLQRAHKLMFVQQSQLALTASLDGLTGLWNRSRIEQSLAEEMARSRRYDAPFSVIMIDVDHFKSVNDTYGHAVGDTILMQLAALLRNNVREVDQVGRLGGEEFLIVLPRTDQFQAEEVARSLQAEVREFEFDTVGQKTASFGVTQHRNGESQKELLGRVDRALYNAKELGRDRVETL